MGSKYNQKINKTKNKILTDGYLLTVNRMINEYFLDDAHN